MFEGRLIVDAPGAGQRNMAIDETLLIDAAENGIATLRFYQWSEPTLSLGYFQRYADRHQHAASRSCAVVRRQTGGGAILHDRELTYSVALPADHPLAQNAPNLYTAVHDAFIAVLQPMLDTTNPSTWLLLQRGEESAIAPTDEPFLCFQRRAAGDVVLSVAAVPQQEENWKVLGSAQRRHRGAVLQHGSLLVEKSPAAPELPGLRDLAAADIDIGYLCGILSASLSSCLELRFNESKIPACLEPRIAELANSKYGSPDWTNRR